VAGYDTVISFKVPVQAADRLMEIAKELSSPRMAWQPVSRHQAARAILLATLGEPGYETMLEQLQLRKEDTQ